MSNKTALLIGAVLGAILSLATIWYHRLSDEALSDTSLAFWSGVAGVGAILGVVVSAMISRRRT